MFQAENNRFAEGGSPWQNQGENIRLGQKKGPGRPGFSRSQVGPILLFPSDRLDLTGIAALVTQPPCEVEIGIAAPHREDRSPAAESFLRFAQERLPAGRA